MAAVQLLIDDQIVDLPGDDIESLLNAARQHLLPSGRVVVEVEVDGEKIDEQVMEADRSAVEAGSQLSLRSADPAELAITVLEQVTEQLQTVETDQREVAELFQQDDQAGALERLSSVLQVWQQTQQAVTQCLEIAGVDIEQLNVQDEPATQVIDLLLEQMRSLRDSLSTSDTVAVADVLMYEWPHVIVKWDALVRELMQRIRTEGINPDDS
jgi:hypothetical protein